MAVSKELLYDLIKTCFMVQKGSCPGCMHYVECIKLAKRMGLPYDDRWEPDERQHVTGNHHRNS
jgi:hypothetical protein